MKRDKHTTKVIFRKFKDGGVVALFPELPATLDPAFMMSYMHLGQHGAAHETLSCEGTLPCTGSEANALIMELIGIGYRLERIYLNHRKYWSIRKAAINNL